MPVKLMTEHHLEFLSLTEGCTGSSESIHVKMPHCHMSQLHYVYAIRRPTSRLVQSIQLGFIFHGNSTYLIEFSKNLERIVLYVQPIQLLGFIVSWKQVTTIRSNTYLTEFSKNLERIERFKCY